jgi:MoxR-like ATPase
LSLKLGTIVKVWKDQATGKPIAMTDDGKIVTADDIPARVLARALETQQSLILEETSSGSKRWKLVPQDIFSQQGHPLPTDQVDVSPESFETPGDHRALIRYLSNCSKLKPQLLKLDDLKWKFAVRSVLRGENLLIRGPHGTGKTTLAQTLPKVLNRPFEYFNLGSTQDPRSSLIGNTHFRADEGTFVAEALFVKAIQQPNTVILLDEITRAHPEAGNILMSVLDKKQRYLRIDERPDTPTIKVAPGVTFIATGNVGSEYTSTRTMDRALLDRFSVLILEPLDLADEVALLQEMFPDVDVALIASIAEIADDTRIQVKSDNPRISTIISTRQTVEMAALAYDGFSLAEIAETCIYPFFSDAGGPTSEVTYMKSQVQMHIKVDPKKSPVFNTDPNNGAKTPWSGVGGGI